MPLSGATGTKWYCEPPPLAESVQTPRSGLSINPHLKWGSLTFRYDELFAKGSDIKHLIADLIGNREDLNGFENPQIDLALLTVFGYD